MHTARPTTTIAPTSAATRRWFTSLAAFGGLAALAARATAQTAPAGPPHGRGPGLPPTPEQMAQAIDQRISRLIKAVDGTPEQKDRLVKLAQAAMADMQPLRAQRMAGRKKGMDLLAASSIDRNALERLRAKLAERMQQRGAHGHGYGGGMGFGGGWGGGLGE